MNIELGTRKNFKKVKEMPPKWKQAAKYGKTMKRYKKFMFWKNCFSSNENKAGLFVNEASEKRGKSAKLKKSQQFKQIQKLKIAKKVWKQALENEKKVVKNKKQMLRKEKTSNSNNRSWCWKKSLRVTRKYLWNAKYYALLRKTVKIER